MSICEKGAIRSVLAGVENLPPEMALYEVIDDKEHSNSNKVFIDIDIHNRRVVIGFENPATSEQIKNMVTWFSINKTHYDPNRIATRGTGYRLFCFLVRGDYTHISNIDDSWVTSSINTTKIFDAEINPEVSNKEFSEILQTSTLLLKVEPELYPRHKNIAENKDNDYPFTPKTIIEAKNVSNETILNYFSNKENQQNILKQLRIKYYNEIFEKKTEIYIKFPNDTEFNKISNNDCIDVIGITNNCINKHIINIFISEDTKHHYGYIIEINGKFYKYKKNGNSILRNLLTKEEYEIFINRTPDYTFVQYNIKNTDNMSPEEKSKLYNSIIGKSLEYYAGVYINIGGVFINSEKVTWGNKERNLQGSKHYRGVLYVNTQNAKQDIGLSGLKAQYSLLTKKNLHDVIKSLTDIYKKYNILGKTQNPDEYVLVQSSAQKSTGEKKLDGYPYIICIGRNFYKLGFESTQTRIYDYNKTEKIEENKIAFPEEEIYEKPFLVYLSLHKIPNIRGLEQNIKSIVNNSDICETYDAQGGDIREYFHCDNFYQVLPLIIKEIENY
jgi:hypothetical protein